jgi:hypothetical protein
MFEFDMVKPVILLLMGPFNKFNCSRYQCSSERFSLTLKYMENWWDFQISSSHSWYSTHHIYMINQSTGLINTLQYKIAGLCYIKSFNPRHLLCVLQ